MTAVAPVLRKAAPRDDVAIVERNALSWIVAHPHYLDRDDAPKREHFASPEGRELYDWIGLCREKSDPISPGDLALLVSEPSKAWLRWMTENPPLTRGERSGVVRRAGRAAPSQPRPCARSTLLGMTSRAGAPRRT